MVVRFRPFDKQPLRQCAPTNRLACRGREGSPASPSGEGNALADLRSRTRPRRYPSPAGRGASGPRCARGRGCQARPSRGGLRQPPSYAAEPGRPAWPPPPLSPGCPRAGRRLPAPAGGEEAAEARRESTWAGAGGGRGASGAARGLAFPALPASRCGGRGAPARVTAPPARPPPGSRRGAGSRRGPGRRRPRAWGRRVRTERTGQGETPGLPRPPCLSQLGCPRARRVPGAAGGLGGEAGAGRDGGLGGAGGPSQAGPGLFGTFRVNFQSAKCLALVLPLVFRSRVWASKRKPEAGK